MFRRIVRGIGCGIAGGIAGTVAMKVYWKVVEQVTGEDPRMRTRDSDDALDEINVVEMQTKEGEGSTAAAGRVLYESALHDVPSEKRKRQISQAVHWSYGAVQGGLYGAVAAANGGPNLGKGTLWGGAMWLLGDEIAVPLLGLAKGPTEYPVSQHVHRLGAHLVYGVAMATVAKTICSR